ncbi:MAG: ABC transporter permease [Bacteroidota bacterium]
MIFPVRSDLRAASVSVSAKRAWPNRYDAAVFALLAAALILLARAGHDMSLPLAQLDAHPVSLDPANLPLYALRSTLRMFAAILASLLFAFAFGALAAKSRKAALVIIPALDILQSVPVLGFLTFTVVFFMGLFPGSQLGAELAAIFAIFTSQAWNMAFSFYQSLVTVPLDLDEACRHFKVSPWLRFWRLEVPFATPGLVWNTMMSMSGGWFFVVASEAITVGDTRLLLPGIGSYIALAVEQRNLGAVGAAVAAMAMVILLYDQLVFRPIVAWADRFRFEATAAQVRPRSWVYDIVRRAQFLRQVVAAASRGIDPLLQLAARRPRSRRTVPSDARLGAAGDRVWLALVLMATAWSVWTIIAYIRATLGMADLLEAGWCGLLTLTRVAVLIAAASLIWVPIGVWIGLRPRVAQWVQPLAQFLAAFPANVLFPFAVIGIVRWKLDPDIWLSPLMVLGTQWYILFNVIAGASVFPTDLREVATVYRLRSWQWWRRVILPGIFPYYVTGALTASGGSWNASIVAEVASWGNTRLEATGLGAYIARATEAGDFHRVVLGIAVMSFFVVVFNRLLWRRLYAQAEHRLRLG